MTTPPITTNTENLVATDAAMKKLLDAHRVLGESRMIKTDTPPEQITDAECQAVIEKVKAYMADRGLTQVQVARGCMFKPSVISQVLSGKYNADPRNVIATLDRWLERRKAADEMPATSKFVWTDVATHIRLAAKRAIAAADAEIDARISLVWGDPGCGKTLALQAVAESTDAIMITCGLESSTTIINKIAAELRIGTQRSNSKQVFAEIVDRLRGSGKLLIVDEIHSLLDCRDDQPFHTLRRLSDQTGCPQLWSATCDLIYQLQLREQRREPLGQIISRIGSQFHVTRVLEANGSGGRGGGGNVPLFSVDDILKVFASNELKLSRDGAEFLASICTSPRYGLLRACTNLVVTATAINRAKGGLLDEKRLVEAAQFLFQDSILRQIQAMRRSGQQEAKLKIA
jgi:DNA transposition AAA+ family ATPase